MKTTCHGGRRRPVCLWIRWPLTSCWQVKQQQRWMQHHRRNRSRRRWGDSGLTGISTQINCNPAEHHIKHEQTSDPERIRPTVSDHSVDRTGQNLVNSPAVTAASADHIFIIAGETDIGYVSRVSKVTLMFGLNRGKRSCDFGFRFFSVTQVWRHLQTSPGRGSQRAWWGRSHHRWPG